MWSFRNHQTPAEPPSPITAVPPLIDWDTDPNPRRCIYVDSPPAITSGRPAFSVELIRGTGPHGALAVIREALAAGDYWVYERAPRTLRLCHSNLVDLWFLVSLCLAGEPSDRREATRTYIRDLLISAQVT